MEWFLENGGEQMAEHKTLAQEMEDIFGRLKELDKLNFPQYRTYQRPDGTWVDREPVPEYLEREELIRRWQEIQKIERYFHTEHNGLLISLRLWCIANSLKDEPEPMDIPLLLRIATSVSKA